MLDWLEHHPPPPGVRNQDGKRRTSMGWRAGPSSRNAHRAQVQLCALLLVLLPATALAASGPTVTLSVTNTDVREVLSQMARQAGVKIVPDPAVTGQVSITLRGVPLREALKRVLTPLGFEANKVGGWFVVTRAGAFTTQYGGTQGAAGLASLLKVEVVPLSYVSVSRVVELTRDAFPDLEVSGDEVLHLVILSGPTQRLADAKRFVASLDQPSPLAPTTEVIKIRNLTAKELAGTLVSLFPGLDIRVQRDANSLVITANAATLSRVKSVISGMDQKSTPPANEPGTETLTLSKVKAKEVLPLFKALFPGVKVVLSTSLNALVVTADPAQMTRVKAWLATVDVLSPLEPVTEAIVLKNADAQSVADTLRTAFPQAKVLVTEDLNALTLIARPSQMSPMKTLITALDVPRQVPIALQQTRVVKLANADVVQVSSILRTMVPGLLLTVDTRRRSLIMNGSLETLSRAIALVAELDARNRQVMLEAYILEVNSGTSDNYGLTITAPATLVFKEDDIKPSNPNDIWVQPLTRSRISVTAVLNLLLSKGRGKILANPKVSVLDGEPARIQTSDKIPVVLTTTSQTQPPVTTQVIQTFEVGIKLELTPRVADDDSITLDILPSVSTITGFSKEGVPQISTREAHTTVRIKDGETVVLGGLMREQDLRTTTRIPILGDIPFFGAIFRNYKTEQVNSELVIIITPHLIEEGSPALENLPQPAPTTQPTTQPTDLPDSSAPAPATPANPPSSMPAPGQSLSPDLPTGQDLPAGSQAPVSGSSFDPQEAICQLAA